MIIFEFPLNERIRRLLRIEEIYRKFEHQLKNTHDYFELGCFNTLFEIVQLVSRSDLKIDFLQELERQEKKQSALCRSIGCASCGVPRGRPSCTSCGVATSLSSLSQLNTPGAV